MPDVSVTPQPWLWQPRTRPIRFIEIHATRGRTTSELQKQAALNNVLSPNNKSDYGDYGASFSTVVGSLGDAGFVLNDNQAPTYSAGYGGPGSEYSIDEYGISLELAQSIDQEPFTDACLRRAAKITAAKCVQYGIPIAFLWVRQQSGPVPTGLVRHDQCQNGLILGKSDPGVEFNEQYFLSLVRAEMEPEEVDMTAEQLANLMQGEDFKYFVRTRPDLQAVFGRGADTAIGAAVTAHEDNVPHGSAPDSYTDEKAVAAVKARL